MAEVTKDTPIALMTLEQLINQVQKELGLDKESFIKTAANRSDCRREEAPTEDIGGKKYVYGINGIRQLFGGISQVTARKYKDTIIADAVSQQGRIIVTDAEKAMRLFYEHTKKRGRR